MGIENKALVFLNGLGEPSVNELKGLNAYTGHYGMKPLIELTNVEIKHGCVRGVADKTCVQVAIPLDRVDLIVESVDDNVKLGDKQ